MLPLFLNVKWRSINPSSSTYLGPGEGGSLNRDTQNFHSIDNTSSFSGGLLRCSNGHLRPEVPLMCLGVPKMSKTPKLAFLDGNVEMKWERSKDEVAWWSEVSVGGFVTLRDKNNEIIWPWTNVQDLLFWNQTWSKSNSSSSSPAHHVNNLHFGLQFQIQINGFIVM